MRSALINLIKKLPFLLSLLRRFSLWRKQIKFKHAAKDTQIDHKTIIFEAYNGRSYACSPRAIYEEMQKHNPDHYQFVWCLREPEKYDFLNSKDTRVIKYEGSEYYKTYASAAAWVNNSIFPPEITKKPQQFFLQTWHGTPLKKLGCDITTGQGNAMNSIKDLHRRYRRESKRFDKLLAPSKFCADAFQSTFGLPNQDKIVQQAYPRNDRLVNATPERIKALKQKLGLPLDKKIILYAPTWRDNQHDAKLGYTYKLKVNFKKWQATLGDDYVMIFRAHYLVAQQYNLKKYAGFIYNFSDYDEISDLYLVSDLLITDYSSVFFDYAILKRPMLFYMYDYDEYRTQMHDFYFDIDELPGPIIKTQKRLLHEIPLIEQKQTRYRKKYQRFSHKYNPLDDGTGAKQAANLIRHELQSRLK